MKSFNYQTHIHILIFGDQINIGSTDEYIWVFQHIHIPIIIYGDRFYDVAHNNVLLNDIENECEMLLTLNEIERACNIFHLVQSFVNVCQ